MRKIKYVVKTREEVIKQRIIVYFVAIVVLVATLLLCISSFKKVEAISQVEETKEVKVNERVSMEENKNKINVTQIIKENTDEVNKKTLSVDEVDLD